MTKEMAFCPYCGTKLPKQATVCPNCHRKLPQRSTTPSMNRLFANPYKEGVARYQRERTTKDKRVKRSWWQRLFSKK